MFTLFSKNNSQMSARSLAVLKIQIVIFAAIIVAFLYVFIDFWIYAALQIILSAVYLWLLFVELMQNVEEKKAYFIFFFLLLLFVEVTAFMPWLLKNFKITNYLVPALVGALVAYALFFRLIFGRNYTYGIVEGTGNNECVVRTDFDLLAFTNAGKFVVKCNKNCKKGQKVKIKVKQGFFSRKPAEII